MNAYTVKTIVHGYHVYRAVWEAAVGQVLPCQQERSNTHDPYAVAVVDRGVIVGHVPRGISSVCYLFINRKGTITCEVTGAKQYTTDLPQGHFRKVANCCCNTMLGGSFSDPSFLIGSESLVRSALGSRSRLVVVTGLVEQLLHFFIGSRNAGRRYSSGKGTIRFWQRLFGHLEVR